MTWLNYHAGLLRQFLVNLLRAVVVFMVVMLLFSLPGADWWADPWPAAGVLLLSLLDSVLPLALLVATLFTVGPRAHVKELTALTAAGYSMLQIMWPLFAVSLLAMGYSWAVRGMGLQMDGPSAVGAAAISTAHHANLAFPLVHVFGVAAGIILASSPTRKSVYGGFLSAFFVMVGYNVVNGAAMILGRHGSLPPVVAGWAGSVIATVVLVIMWRRRRL